MEIIRINADMADPPCNHEDKLPEIFASCNQSIVWVAELPLGRAIRCAGELIKQIVPLACLNGSSHLISSEIFNPVFFRNNTDRHT
jgi:hypothetical protein